MKTLPNKTIHVCWDIVFGCNLRCPYCFCGDKWEKLSSGNRFISADKWGRCWDKFFKKYGSADITISGGEPFFYPDFMNIVRKISGRHKVGICTNLSFDVEEFCRSASPEKVSVYPSFHPDLDDSLAGIMDFAGFYIGKILYLEKKGFDSTVSCVAYPPRLEYIEELKEMFDSRGVNFIIQPFLGEYEGKKYPGAYNEREKTLLERIANIGRESLSFQLEGKPSKGRLCRAGQSYFRIHPDGSIFRCSYEPLSGNADNFIEGAYLLYDAPKKCAQEFCYCNDEFKYLLEDKK